MEDDNAKDALRREFGNNISLHELVAAGYLVNIGGHGQHEPPPEQRLNLRALIGAAEFLHPGDAELDFEESGKEDTENGFIMTP